MSVGMHVDEGDDQCIDWNGGMWVLDYHSCMHGLGTGMDG
jgi:hypothetical protein